MTFFLGAPVTLLPSLVLGDSLCLLLSLPRRLDLTLGFFPSGLTWGCLNEGPCCLPWLLNVTLPAPPPPTPTWFLPLPLPNLFFLLLLLPALCFAARMSDLTLGLVLLVVDSGLETPTGMAVVEGGGRGVADGRWRPLKPPPPGRLPLLSNPPSPNPLPVAPPRKPPRDCSSPLPASRFPPAPPRPPLLLNDGAEDGDDDAGELFPKKRFWPPCCCPRLPPELELPPLPLPPPKFPPPPPPPNLRSSSSSSLKL